jgi:hypothetical protein
MDPRILTAIALVQTLCFKILWLISQLLQSVAWRINGVHAQKMKMNENGEQCVELLDIVWKYKPDSVMVPSSVSDFITTHNAFVRPDYILQDHVTLYALTDSEAIFVESDPGVDVTHSSTHFFMYSAQYLHAKRIIRMPLAVLKRLSTELGNPRGTMLFLSSTGRCGSTLFCQMFEQTGRSVCFSEPSIFAMGHSLSDAEYKAGMKAALRVLCKPWKNRDVDVYVIKTPAYCTNMVPLFCELFPDSQHLFMYRDGVKVAKSYHELLQRVCIGPIMQARFTNLHVRFLLQMMGIKIRPAALKLFTADTMHFYLWADCCYEYLRLRDSGLRIGGVRHEDLVACPLESSRAIMEVCGFPQEWAGNVLQAMATDSMQSLKAQHKRPLTPLHMDPKVVSTYCDIFGLPHHSSVLPGTITKQKE